MATFLSAINASLPQLETGLRSNPSYKASTKSVTLTFGFCITNNPPFLVIKIINGDSGIQSSARNDTAFDLCATAAQWNAFFQPVPVVPFQSYWGMLRTIGPENGVQVQGERSLFAKYCRVWRLALDQVRETLTGVPAAVWDDDDDEEGEEDFITGRYIHTSTRLYGRARVFVESAGHGLQHIIFLHTAGSDSRQAHAFMNRSGLQQRFSMHAFDLPGHGRSEFGSKQVVGELGLDEEGYLEVIRQVILKLRLEDVVLCGASMAGQICLAAALRGPDIGVKGVIACEACAHIEQNPRIYGYDGGDEALLNPETVCGMMAPMSSEKHKRQVWWGYSAQGQGVFKGDLRFYFSGWDGRGRLGGIRCPVYMLTGEYDYSCTSEMSRRTFEEIRQAGKGEMVAFEVMARMGHFPFSENPGRFLEYFERAVEFIEKKSIGAV